MGVTGKVGRRVLLIANYPSYPVVPELNQELHVWIERQPLMAKLDELDATLGDIFMNLDSSSLEKPDISKVQMTIRYDVRVCMCL